MTTSTIPRAPSGNGTRHGQSPFDLETPAGGAHRSRRTEITVGLLLAAVFTLAGTWFYASSTDRDAVLALRNDVGRGEVITNDDLRVVQINSDDALNVLARDQAGVIVGRVALGDLSAGTLVTPDQVAAVAPIAAGEGIVGLALDPGEYPSLSMRPGDVVRVVRVPAGSEPEDNEAVLAEAAEIVDVAPIGVQNQLFVSLALDTGAADAVAAAASRDRVRLVQVARS